MEFWSGYPGDASSVYLPPNDIGGILFYFFLYSCLGWMLEHGYHWAVTGRFAGEGFLTGPWKPMYGFSPVLLLALAGPATPLWLLAVLGFVIPTAVEYASGILLRRLFRKQYWSYAECRFQIGGLICLRFSLYWMLLGFATVYVLHPAAAWLYALIRPVWLLGWPAAAAVLLLDVGLTVARSAAALGPAAK